MGMVNQTELIKKLRNRDKKSFFNLYQNYSVKIYNLAYRTLGNHDDAQDITQNTFLQVFQNVDHFKQQACIYTWIYPIAKNLCYHLLQKKNSFTSLETLVFSVQNEDNPEEISESEKQLLINQVKEGCLTGLLKCLSFYQRIAFILHILFKISIRDVSEIVDKSEGATKVLIFRARQNLKIFLCKNCSLYNNNNPCRCENLIDFSLKQGWINRPSDSDTIKVNTVDTKIIEQEIKDFKKITFLYKNLTIHQPPLSFNQKILQIIQNRDLPIFQQKKV